MVFQFGEEAATRSRMAGPLVKDPKNMRCERDGAQQVIAKLALLSPHISLGESSP
jgi:hypothetical protein